MEHWRRDIRFWQFFRALLGGWLRRKFNFTPEPAETEGPCLILANHATDWDPLLVALSFPRQMYFVASEHIFRWGFFWKIINWLLHPIARLKGTTASDTVLTVMRRMRRGASVAIFADGNRTWDGCTGEIFPATGKLARSCGGTLITYRLEGGYFTNPRWAGGRLRRGQMRGRVAGVYPPETLRAMTPEEITAVIRRDLWEDAYARQRAERVPFRGRRAAEGLETMLCVCPSCGALGTLQSAGDRLRCSACGLEAVYDVYGFLSGPGLPFDSIRDWDRWQTEQLSARSAGNGPEPLFSDEGITLEELLPGHATHRLGEGAITLYRDRLVCAGRSFPLPEISGMGMHGPLGLSFSAAGGHYEVSGRRRFCLRKYMTVFDRLCARAGQSRVVI